MLDEARPRAGSDSQDWSDPAGQTPGRARRAGATFAGATGEIVVTRIIAGVQLTSREKRSSFQGVMLRAPAPGLLRGYSIVLAALSDADNVVLAHDLSENEVVASWRAIAASLGLPAMLRHANGEMECLHRQIGGVSLGRSRSGRRKTVSNKRRSAFLMRRKAGRTVMAKG